jgi:signal transduction histidine kinase
MTELVLIKIQSPLKKGVGINQMDVRIVMMQGKFTIVMSKGNGTVIKVSLPIQEKKRLTSCS